ncbi:dihydrolipoamide dehydrogenase, partial [Bifidobacterium breve]|nr:dihydrolipoamide dehydrogenase [Bifidobacterium breve]
TLREAKADTELVDVTETLIPVMSNARMLMSGASGSVSVVSGKKSADQSDDAHVLGVHIVSPDASDLIAEAQ